MDTLMGGNSETRVMSVLFCVAIMISEIRWWTYTASIS